MHDSPPQQSAMQQVQDTELSCRDYGFYWTHIDQLIDQVQSECLEVQECWEQHDLDHLEEEVGDLLLAATSLAIFCQLDPEATLKKSCAKFEKRYAKLKELAAKDGHADLQGQPFDLLLHYWKEAKQQTTPSVQN